MDTEQPGNGEPGSGGHPPGEPQGTESPLETLIQVQDLDIAISQLERRKTTLAERKQLEALDERRGDLERRAAELNAQRQVLIDRQGELEEQIGALNARRKALEDRLYADRGSAARDLQTIEAEVQHLTQRRAELEEIELGIMEDQDPIDAAVKTVVSERGVLDAEAEVHRGALEQAEHEVDGELAGLITTRAATAKSLPTELGDRYDVLRSRLGGIGAARLVGNRCEGCHLELPSKEVDRIRRLAPESLVTCDQCGRILVRSSVRS